ncbi:MAG: hypothetical protein RIE73_19040 [Coleofasciculus sp. C1-SOL-03]
MSEVKNYILHQSHQPPWVKTQGTNSESRLKTTASLVLVHFNGL